MTKEEDVTELKFDDLEGMLENLWNATVEDLEDTNRQFDFPFSIFNKEMLLEKEKYFREEAEKAGMSLNEYLEKMSKEVEE